MSAVHDSEPSDAPSDTSPPPAAPGVPTPPVDRRDASDRRARVDRRTKQVHVPVDRRAGGDRRTVDRRDPAKRAGNYDLDDETLEFIAAINRFKASTGKSFPTWSEVMEIVRELGYVKADA